MRLRGTPLRIAISMYGDVMTLMMAARVMRAMCATTDVVRVRIGSASDFTSCHKDSYSVP